MSDSQPHSLAEKPADASAPSPARHSPAPAPYDWSASGAPGGNGLKNIYVLDTNGRKIAAVWGKPGEKEATADLFMAAPKLLHAARIILETLHSHIDSAIEAGVPVPVFNGIVELQDAIAEATGGDHV